MIGIYKITNLLNNKNYIGQSVHIERRWIEHCMPHSNSYIAQAIKKYGKENFSFEVIEECLSSELDIKENYWIKYYNSIVPNGYNIVDNTSSNHTLFKTFDKQILEQIIYDIQTSSLSLKEIADKYELDKSTITRINKGEVHKQESISYPIRNTNYSTSDKNKCIDCGKIISTGSLRCVQCEGIRRRKDLPLTKEELKQLIRKKPFTQIAKDYNVSDNAIRKWCDKYNLPRTKKEIKNLSEEDWKNI